jgi:chemotaxis protein MotB
MYRRKIGTICRAFLLILSLTELSACLVEKGKYTDELKARQECQRSLDQSQQGERRLEGRVQDLEQRLEQEAGHNRALLEELAALQAEREEHMRKVSMYEQKLEEREHQISRVTDTYKNLIDHLSQEIHEGKIRIDQSETRLKLNLVDKILFPSGSAQLTAKGKEVLDKVGFALKEINDRRIMIEGHTDDVPLSPNLQKRYGSNWGLSAMRATAVVHYLQENGGIDPRLLTATGYSMYRPLRENDTTEGRQANRRIEIILTPLSPQEMQELHASPTQGAAPPSIPSALPESP